MEATANNNLKDLVNENLWLNTVNHQLEIGEIEMCEELTGMIQQCKLKIKNLNKTLNYTK